MSVFYLFIPVWGREIMVHNNRGCRYFERRLIGLLLYLVTRRSTSLGEGSRIESGVSSV